MAPAVSMPAPVCLIENTPNGELLVNQKALRILSSITEPVVVVSIVGLYRTGKSYLMNKLAGKMKGFSLGSTVQSHTKGIWMWCVPHPHEPNQTLVLLDTEGLGDVEKGDQKNDCWIFALAVLLSSTLVYNSMGTIDQYALEKLHYVTELTELIKVKSSDNEEDDSTQYARFFPAFIWTVRDFTLELKVNGHSITEDEYLDNALKLKPGCSRKVQEYNLLRGCIRNFFPSRKCFVFDCPTSRENLQRMEELDESKLDPRFLSQAGKFCSYVFNSTKPKTLKGGHTVTGALFGTLAVTYVDTIRSGSVPCLENAVLTLSQIENTAAVQDALSHYQKKMSEHVQLPTETVADLLKIHAQCETEATKIFMKRSFKDENQEFHQDLMRSVLQSYEEYCRKNEQASAAHCKALLTRLFHAMEEKISQAIYLCPGGYQRYIQDQKGALDTYRAQPGKGIKADEVLQEFLKSKEPVTNSILLADQSLSQKEKEMEEERVKAEAKELQMKVMKEAQEALEQEMKDQQRSYKEHVQQLEVKMEADRQKLQKEQQTLLDQKLKEQQSLLEEGFKEKADVMKQEIRALQEEAKRNKSSSLSSVLETFTTIAMAVLPRLLLTKTSRFR
ncbi:guanylate-binding protein 1-like [Latimeria chalumnae]|uniref:GB1/RHD3-type G domain-containing protein n=1 Tax=Latimeria chalumnae TaxID=7897 RepID=H3AZZ0_LATCH|nr:PREDICTED: guanylate-binding protein 1-like [Latimeria chalumnae]|eukprot:XP_005998038.1 PREDICTED: guanylate-binding protein 1-like [Latimeria chalumnae]